MGSGLGQVRSLGGEVIGLPEPGLEKTVRTGRTRTMAIWCLRKEWPRGQGQGRTHLQQQLHHAQAVVFHGVDEWGAAAFNVLRREGRSLTLSKLCPKSWRPALRPRPLGPASRQSCQGPRAPPTQAGALTPVPPLWTPPLLAPPPACAPLLTTASMSAPRSSNSSTASWHSVFTATCRAVSPS